MKNTGEKQETNDEIDDKSTYHLHHMTVHTFTDTPMQFFMTVQDVKAYKILCYCFDLDAHIRPLPQAEAKPSQVIHRKISVLIY